MNIPTNVDLTKFTEVKVLEVWGGSALDSELANGWRLIAIGIKRSETFPDGSFTDGFVALIGREDS